MSTHFQIPAPSLGMVERDETVGPHRLLQAESLHVLPHLSGVDHVVTDPPYSSGGMMRGDRMGKTSSKYQNTEDRRRYAEFIGDNRDQRAFGYWSALWLGAALRATRPGGLCLMFTDWRQLPQASDALQAGGWVWRGIVVWDKTESTRPQLGRFRQQAEYVVWSSNGGMPLEGACPPGVYRYRVKPEDKQHITAKPVDLMLDLLALIQPGETVLDPFMGAGATGVAAARRGCRFVGIEQDPTHFETARARIAAVSGQAGAVAAGDPSQGGLF